MLITRPNHDIATNYLFYWSIALIDYAKRNNIPVTDLSKKRASSKEFNSVVNKIKPDFIVLNGHGDDNSVTGYDNETLLNINYHSELLKGKVVYARSCSPARKLGPKSISKGCRAYIGYDDEFVFMISEDKITRPLEDKTAEIFLEPANYLVILLLKGHTAAEANFKSREKYKQNILKLMTSSSTNEEREMIPYLTRNYLHQVNLGDGNAVV